MATLQQGSVGPAVSTLQARLNALNVVQPLLAVDGIFGPKTLPRGIVEVLNQETRKILGVLSGEEVQPLALPL